LRWFNAWPEFEFGEGDEDDMEAVLRELHLSELKIILIAHRPVRERAADSSVSRCGCHRQRQSNQGRR